MLYILLESHAIHLVGDSMHSVHGAVHFEHTKFPPFSVPET